MGLRATKDVYPENGRKLRTDAEVSEVYELGVTIGTGAFSKVKLATEKATGEQYACKIVYLPRPGEQEIDEQITTRAAMMREIDALLDLDHPNIVQLKEYFVQKDKAYLIMELLRGGELLDAVLEAGRYSEEDARTIFLQLISGVHYMHNMGVVHRDLKLENLLLDHPGDISCIKIADFGLAKKHPKGRKLDTMNTCLGTPLYIAPEVILRGSGAGGRYDHACDRWSIGVILHILLVGYPPFWAESEPTLLRKIVNGKLSLNTPEWDKVSDEAKDLVSKLLVVDPAKRIRCKQVRQHPWLRHHASEEQLWEAFDNMHRKPLRRADRPPLVERLAAAGAVAAPAQAAPVADAPAS